MKAGSKQYSDLRQGDPVVPQLFNTLNHKTTLLALGRGSDRERQRTVHSASDELLGISLGRLFDNRVCYV